MTLMTRSYVDFFLLTKNIRVFPRRPCHQRSYFLCGLFLCVMFPLPSIFISLIFSIGFVV